ncbi:MAG: L-threonylcarbamoyladenylate synthase [Nitrosopumilus sp.]
MKVNCDAEGIGQASKVIEDGGIVVFPTDTVYGIGCNPYNKESAKKVYEIKSRDFSKPFPVLVYSKEIASQIAEFDEISERLVEKFWPGQLTILLKLKDMKLKESLNLSDKIALRVPNHKCTLALLEKCHYLIGTSANVSGQPSFFDPAECIKSVENYDVFVDGGTITSKGESTIIQIEDGEIKIIREGSLSKEEILKV